MSDLHYALRSLRKNPGFTAVAVLTLTIGIGATTAVFSLVDAVLLRSLPVRAPGELVLLSQRIESRDVYPFSRPAFEFLRDKRDVLAGLAAFRPWRDMEVAANGDTQPAHGQMVSGNYFSVLGVRALHGRTLTESDDRPGQTVAVISHRFWQTRFGGDPSIVGKTIQVQGGTPTAARTGTPVTIVGLTPPDFFGTKPGEAIDVTLPLAMQSGPLASSRNARWLYVIGRRQPGVSLDEARAKLRVSWAQFQASEPRRPGQAVVTFEMESGAQGLNELRRQFSLPLRILTAAVAVVLLIACANIASLLLVRAVQRTREITVRIALGARRSRLVRQLLTESAVLAVAGGAGGVLLAYAATDVIVAMMSRGRFPISLDVAPDVRTLGFAATATLLTAAAFGLLPALRATAAANDGHTAGSRTIGAGRNRVLNAIVVSQIALLMLLLSGAGLFARTLVKLHGVDAGFQKDDVLLLSLRRGDRSVYQNLYARLSALPGVHAVTLSVDTPLQGELSYGSTISVPGQPPAADDAPPVYHNHVGPRFFETLRIPLVAGRDFTERDNEAAASVVVISESVARQYFRGGDALGKQIVLGTATSPRGQVPATVVGVAKDVRFTTLRDAGPQMVYRPYLQSKSIGALTFCIRTDDEPERLMSLLEREVRAVIPDRPIFQVRPLAEQVNAALVEERTLAALSGFFGVTAAVLACVGLYGTVAHSVARRTREIGIRIALGAQPGRVARMVLRESFALVGWGLAVGVPAAMAAAYASSSLIADLLFELKPTDPSALTLAAAGVLIVSGFAAFVPAHRAARVDPISALRAE